MRNLGACVPRCTIALGLVLAASCAPTDLRTPESVGLSSGGLERATELIQNEIDAGHIAGAVALVARRGEVVYHEGLGMQDREAEKPMRPDTIFRIASMTKPIISVAAMVLVEAGRIGLDQPVAEFIPEFQDVQVVVPSKDDPSDCRSVPAERGITVRDLLTHTSGITYRFLDRPCLERLYREAGISDGLVETEGTIGDAVARLARLPLKHSPGAAWEYGLSTDVLGRVIEVASGQPLDRFLAERVFEPLGMRDSCFFPPDEKLDRLAAVYTPARDGTVGRLPDGPQVAGPTIFSATNHARGPKTYFSGGAGLVSTAEDYARFLQMLLNKGELDGARLLKPETVASMTSNQIGDLTIWWPVHGDTFGLGFGVFSPAMAGLTPESPGTYSWGGFFYTDFWVDPRRELIGVLMAQLYPSKLTLREDFRRAVYRALVE